MKVTEKTEIRTKLWGKYSIFKKWPIVAHIFNTLPLYLPQIVLIFHNIKVFPADTTNPFKIVSFSPEACTMDASFHLLNTVYPSPKAGLDFFQYYAIEVLS